MATVRRCEVCGKPLPVRSRADARYCPPVPGSKSRISPCRDRAAYLRKLGKSSREV